MCISTKSNLGQVPQYKNYGNSIRPEIPEITFLFSRILDAICYILLNNEAIFYNFVV